MFAIRGEVEHLRVLSPGVVAGSMFVASFIGEGLGQG